VLGALIVVRLAWRLAHRPPAFPRSLSGWQQRAAALVHRAAVRPAWSDALSGYLASNFSKRGVKFFGVVLRRGGRTCRGLHRAQRRPRGHRGGLQRADRGHVAAALKHVLVDRDAVFARMWWGRTRMAAMIGIRLGGESLSGLRRDTAFFPRVP
jgi:cytochrome b561